MRFSRQTEKSLWRDVYPSKPIYPELEEDLEVDVVVIGAGITGLMAAYLLKQAGRKVVVIDKDTVGGGTTGRTTGKVTSQHELNYRKLTDRLGKGVAREYAESNQAAIDLIEAIITREGIECDWQRDDNYAFTTEAKNVERLRQEAHAVTELGLPASFETEAPLPFDVLGAVKFKDQAKFHAQRYLLGLAAAIDGDGSYVFENSRARRISDGDSTVVTTKHGRITAKHTIVATHVPTFPLLARISYALLEYPTESFAVAGPLSADIEGMYISPDKDHYSIQPVTVKGQRMLVVVGAGGNIPGLAISRKRRFKKLASYAESLGLERVTHHWSDMDYKAYDEVPLIGKLYPWSKNLYTATGFKKWGLSGGTVAAVLICDMIAGSRAASSSFDSTRIRPIRSIPGAVIEHLKSKL